MNKKDQRIYNKTKKYLEKKKEENIDDKLEILKKILNIKNREERLSFIYDSICDYLDNEFKEKNICDFKCNICVRKRDLINKKEKETYENGCCYSYRHKSNCEYLGKNGCKIKNIRCKLYTCHYLKKRGYKYKLDNIYLARYLLNVRQKYFIITTPFVPKEEVMKGILKRDNFYYKIKKS